MLEVDSTVPSEEQYAKAYACARRLFDAAPWEKIEDTQVLAVSAKSGEMRFVQALGQMGDHLAAAVYPDFQSLDAVCTANGEDEESAIDALFSVRQLQVAFLGKPSLCKGERETIAASGIKFKNGKWPTLTSFVPGYIPDKMGAAELAECVECVTEFLDCLESGVDIRALTGPRELVTTWTRGVDGKGMVSLRRHDIEKPCDFHVSPELVAKVRALPAAGAHFECGAFPMRMMGDKWSWRRKADRMCFMVELNRNLPVPPRFVSADDGRAFDVNKALDAFLEMFVSLGIRPDGLFAQSRALFPFWHRFCDEIGAEAVQVGGETISSMYKLMVRGLMR